MDFSMNTTATKTMRLTMEPKMMDIMPYGLPTNSQYTPAIEPSTMDQMPAPAVAFFQVRPSRNAANGPADLMVKANTRHRNDGFAYERDNDGDDAEE